MTDFEQTSPQDIRWIQRFAHFAQAFLQLKEAVELAQQRELSKLEEQGLIQAFEYTHELAWNTLKDFLEERGARDLYGSKDATREAFKGGLIANGEVWMDMIKSRNLTSHTYNENTAAQIASAILDAYFPEFSAFRAKYGRNQTGRTGMKYGLKESVVQQICGVLARYPQVDRAVLYGSRAKGNYKNGSDIDLSLCGVADLTLRVFYRIMDELDDLLLPYTIDLSICVNITDPDVLEHIQRAGVTFYEKNSIRELPTVS